MRKNSTGNHSTGNGSTGSHSTGHFSTGHYSTGHFSTGNWSTGHYSTGHFCTKDGKGFGAFNKKLHESYEKACKIWEGAEKPNCLYFDLIVVVDSSSMTDLEKSDDHNRRVTGRYLEVYDYKEAFTKSVLNAGKEERDMIRALPNFDADVFLEISGCDLRLID